MTPESNTPQPSPRELLEERVIALLLGELSENDGAEIKALMQADASLKAFHDEMLETIDVVGEAHRVADVKPEDVPGANLKLDDTRRAALLEVIGEKDEEPAVEAPEIEEKIARPWFRHSTVKIAAALIALCVPLGGLFLSIKSKPKMGMLSSEIVTDAEMAVAQLTSEDFDGEAEEEHVADQNTALPSAGQPVALSVHASSADSDFIAPPSTPAPGSFSVQLQTEADGAAPNVRFSDSTPQQQLFLPGQGQSASQRRYFRQAAAGESGGNSQANPFVGNSRGAIRVDNEIRLAEKAEANLRRGQSAAPGRVAGAAGQRVTRESEPKIVDAITSGPEVSDIRSELRADDDLADAFGGVSVPANGLLDAFGQPIGGGGEDTIDASQMDAAFEQAAGGARIAAFGRTPQTEGLASGVKSSGIAAADEFVAGRATARQNRGKDVHFGWAAQIGQAAVSADGELGARGEALSAQAMFDAPESVESESRAVAKLERESLHLAAPKLPALTAQAEMDAKKSAETAWFDSGGVETAKAKRKLSRGAIAATSRSAPAPAEIPPPAAPPQPAIVAGVMDLTDQLAGAVVDFDASSPEPLGAPVFAGTSRGRARDLGVAPQSGGQSQPRSARKSNTAVIRGMADRYNFAELNQGVVAGKPVEVMDEERVQKLQEEVVRKTATVNPDDADILLEAPGSDLAVRLVSPNENAVLVESGQRDLAEVERLGRLSESKAIPENFSRAAVQPMYKLSADKNKGLAKLEKRLEDSESQLAAKEAQVQQQFAPMGEGIGGGAGGGFGGGGAAADRLDAWRRSQEEFKSTERTLNQSAQVGDVQRKLERLSELRAGAEREIEYTKSNLNKVARQLATVNKAGNRAEIAKWSKESTAWESRVKAAQTALENVEQETQAALSRYQESMIDGGDAEIKAGESAVRRDESAGIMLGGEFVNAGKTIAQISGGSPTVVTMILRSGGVKEDGDLSRVQVARKGGAIETVNVEAILEGTGLNSDVALNAGDQLIVPSRIKKDVAKEPAKKPAQSKPNPEIQTKDNAFSTFSLNVSDVSFKLAAASLEKGQLPEPASVRSEEFVNAFNYRDPAPTGGEKLSFAWERAGDPFQHNRDLIRFSIQTAAVGRESGRPLNIVVLLDNSGSMERSDRLAIVRRALMTLAEQMTPNDRISIVAFARTPRLWVNGMKGGNPEQLVSRVLNLIPQGGTNLEAALDLGYEVAQSHFRADGNNRVILLTDGAANLGDVDPARLKAKTEAQRKKGIALDCFGIGWEGLNDEMLESLTRNADGRYGFLNTEHEAREDFADQLAGALQVAASNVKAQVEFNPRRVISFRQIGYEKHQLKKEQFRDNTVDAAEIGAAESGTALYSIQVNHQGQGPLGVARIRFLNPGTGVYEELEWPLPYCKDAPSLADAKPSMRLAGTAAAFAEWLAKSPYAGGVTPVELQNLLSGVAENYPNDARPKQLEAMIRQARQTAGATGGP